MAKKWIPDDLKKGALHRALNIPEDKEIPISLINSKIEELHKKSEGDKKLSDSEQKLLHRLIFAKNAKKFKHETTSYDKYNIIKESIQGINE